MNGAGNIVFVGNPFCVGKSKMRPVFKDNKNDDNPTDVQYRNNCDEVLLGRVLNPSGTVSIEFDKDGSSLAFLQELVGRHYKGYKKPEYHKYSYQKQCLVGVKLLRSKSKQSRMIAVVVNC